MAVLTLFWSTIVALLCVETAKAEAVVATLSADATRVPGGYAVPVGGNITFTCFHNGSSERSLFWQFHIVNGTVTMIPTSAFHLRNEPGLSTSAGSHAENPVNVTIHNLQLDNNGSTVTCQLENEGPPTVILVEGVPSCAMLNLTSLAATASSLLVTLSAVKRPWLLPVLFQVKVSSGDFHTMSFNTITNYNTFIFSIQPGTQYNISVTPCNSFGCNEGCPAYVHITIATPSEGIATTQSGTEGGVANNALVDNLWAIILIPLVVLLALIAIIIAVAAIAIKCHAKNKLSESGAKEKHGGKEQRVFKGGGDGGMALSMKSEPQITEVIEPVELDVNPAYIPLH